MPYHREKSSDPRQEAATALATLVEGNARFASGTPAPHIVAPTTRESLLEGQDPIAVLLGCVDSRVPPEVVHALGLLKKAAALVNQERGVLDAERADLIRSMTTLGSAAAGLGQFEVLFGDCNALFRLGQQVQGATMDQVRSAARRFFHRDRVNVASHLGHAWMTGDDFLNEVVLRTLGAHGNVIR